MKIQFYIQGLNLSADLRRGLEQSLWWLQSFAAVSEAAVVLERRKDAAPAFRAYVSLAVPGPDIHAEARDHTLQAAWLKVTAALRQQIEQRKLQQEARLAQAGNGPRRKRGFPRISCGRIGLVGGG